VTRSTSFLLSCLVVLLIHGASQAQQPLGPEGPTNPPVPCARLLLSARADTLEHALGLSKRQTAKIAALRTNYWNQRLGLRLEISQTTVKLNHLMMAELPDETKVLQALRKLRRLRGQLAEGRTKMELRSMAVLTRGQRAKLRAHCFGLAERAEHRCTGGRCNREDKPSEFPRDWGWEPYVPGEPWSRPPPFDSGRPFDAPYGPPGDSWNWY